MPPDRRAAAGRTASGLVKAQRGAARRAGAAGRAGRARREVGMRWADERQRATTRLLFVGERYRATIESCWRSSPAAMRQFPTRLEDPAGRQPLPRAQAPRASSTATRASRRSPWAEIRLGSAIVGVRSQSDSEPFRRSGFTLRQSRSPKRSAITDWQFTAKSAAPAADQLPAFARAHRSSLNPFLTPDPLGTSAMNSVLVADAHLFTCKGIAALIGRSARTGGRHRARRPPRRCSWPTSCSPTCW